MAFPHTAIWRNVSSTSFSWAPGHGEYGLRPEIRVVVRATELQRDQVVDLAADARLRRGTVERVGVALLGRGDVADELVRSHSIPHIPPPPIHPLSPHLPHL